MLLLHIRLVAGVDVSCVDEVGVGASYFGSRFVEAFKNASCDSRVATLETQNSNQATHRLAVEKINI